MTKIPENPNEIVWPVDTAGILQPLKREILKAVDRTRGHPDKLTTLFDTLVLAAKFTRVRGPILQAVYQPNIQVEPEPVEEPVVEDEEKSDAGKQEKTE